MALLAYLGEMTWDEYDARPYRDHRRLAARLIALHKARRDADVQIWGEFLKAFVSVVARMR